MGKRGRKKRAMRSELPPEFHKTPAGVWPLVQAGLFGNPCLFGTYSLILALSWKDGFCDWTNAALAEVLGVSEREIKTHVAKLKRIGLVESHVASSKPFGSSEGGRLLVPASPERLAEIARSLLQDAGRGSTEGIRGKKTSPQGVKKTSPQINYREEDFPRNPRDEGTTRVDTDHGGVMSNHVLDKNNTPPHSRELGDRGVGEWGGISGKKTSLQISYREENFPQNPGDEEITRVDTAPEGISGKKTSPQINYREENFPAIPPALSAVAREIGLTPGSKAERLLARRAREHRGIGPRRLLALWRKVQESGGRQGVFVNLLKSGFEPNLLAEPNHDTPGFCPVCGARVSLSYGAPECPNGHKLRICDVCGELAPADGACPWCGAEPEEDPEPEDTRISPASQQSQAGYDRREEAESVWREALRKLRVQFYHTEFDRLFAGTSAMGFEDGRLVVHAPDGYSGSWLSGRLHEKVLDVVKGIDRGVSEIEFVWDGREDQEVNV